MFDFDAEEGTGVLSPKVIAEALAKVSSSNSQHNHSLARSALQLRSKAIDAETVPKHALIYTLLVQAAKAFTAHLPIHAIVDQVGRKQQEEGVLRMVLTNLGLKEPSVPTGIVDLYDDMMEEDTQGTGSTYTEQWDSADWLWCFHQDLAEYKAFNRSREYLDEGMGV